jgi:hypothetical protein
LRWLFPFSKIGLVRTMDQASLTRRQRTAPVITLVLLSSVIAEVLFGATRITTLFVLIPEIGVWGCAALMIREVVRRRRQGWPAILLLGVALAAAEELVIQQTSLIPLIGVDPAHVYGRADGVNWIYLLWALGYESVWAVVLPIQLVEVVFPDCRDEPWLGRRGLIVCAMVLVLSSFVAWYSWTQVLVPQYLPESVSRVPLPSVAIGAVVVGVLVAAALSLRPSSRHGRGTSLSALPPSWQMGLATFMLGLPWFGLVLLAYGALPTLSPAIPALAGLVLAGVSFVLVRFWSSNPAWQDLNTLGLVSGALLASMLGGAVVLMVGRALPIDRIGQAAFSVVAVVWLMRLASRDRGHREEPGPL